LRPGLADTLKDSRFRIICQAKNLVPVQQGNVRRTLESAKFHPLIRCFVKVNFILLQKCVARFCTIRVSYYKIWKDSVLSLQTGKLPR